MGSYRRLIQGAGLVSALLIALAGCGDKAKQEQQRRELLRPPKIVQEAKKPPPPPVFDGEGVPLPSDLVLGGFAVPRGFEVTKKYDDEWFLRSSVVSAEATAKYVQARVFTGSLERTSVGGVRFESAQLRDAMQAPRLSLRISPTKGHPNACELYIRRIVPQKQVTRTAESVAQTLRESARYAQ